MKYLTLAILFLILLSCEKENSDYRDNYTGNYSFTIKRKSWLMGDSIVDTSFYNGFIKKNKNTTDRIVIRFGDDIWGRGTYNDVPFEINDYPEPILKTDGKLSYPEYPVIGSSHFNGSFITFDSISLKMSYGGLGGGTVKYVYGHKN
jgi:hypothetical protein